MSQNSFWDTVKGHQLADVLIKYLPTIAKNATVQKQTKQYTMIIRNSNKKAIDDELNLGAKIVSITPCPENNLFIVFEKGDSNE